MYQCKNRRSIFFSRLLYKSGAIIGAMKKITTIKKTTMQKICTVFMCLVSLVVFSQETEEKSNSKVNNKHELRLDGLEALLIPTIEINYEYVLSRYSGLGAAISYSFENDDVDINQKFAFTPYYRQYFFNKKEYGARGFFVEGLLQFATGEDYYGEINDIFPVPTNTGKNWFNTGIGLAIGQKWVSNNGFVFELSAGGGRYFIDNEGPEAFFRGGILVGYRF